MKRSKAPSRGPSSAPSRATCPSNSPAPSWMLLLAFAILVLLALTLIYQYLIVQRVPPATKPQEGFKGSSSSKKASEAFGVPSGSSTGIDKQPSATLVFLYMNGCGWCEKFKPQWDQFVATYGTSLAANGVAVVSYERSDPNAKQYDEYVKGYPTVLLVTSSVIVFQGERTSHGLADFLQKNGLSGALKQA